MKLAIVNQHASTGGWKYLYMLVKNIIKLRPDFDITVFIRNIDGVDGIEKLKQIGVKMQPIEYQDERLTTVMAHNVLSSNNVSAKKRKDTVDAVSAVMILQSYIDSHKR